MQVASYMLGQSLSFEVRFINFYFDVIMCLLWFREPGLWALERAKQNVLENYLLVGILEELEDVLLLFERLLPQYFTGVVDIYKGPGMFFFF